MSDRSAAPEAEPPRHGAEEHRLPVAIEQLVRQRAHVLAPEGGTHACEPGIVARHCRPRRQQPVHEGHRLPDMLDDAGSLPARRLGVRDQQLAHRQEARPAGQGVVAEIEHAARTQPRVHEAQDRVAVGVGDPAPHAVQADEVEFRQVAAGAVAGERLVGDRELGTGCRRQPSRCGGMQGIEIGAVPGNWRGRSMDGEARALAIAQFARGPDGRWPDTGPQQHEARAQRIELGLVAPNVGDRDAVGLRHRRSVCRAIRGVQSRRCSPVPPPGQGIRIRHIAVIPSGAALMGGVVEGPLLPMPQQERSLHSASLRLRSGQALRSASVGMTEVL